MLPTRRLASHKTHQEQKCSQAERVVAAQWHCVDERSARGLRACGGAILYYQREKQQSARGKDLLIRYVRTLWILFDTRRVHVIYLRNPLDHFRCSYAYTFRKQTTHNVQ